eukprot:1714695-Pleurochrysis_carterae.AAC.1
MNIKPRYRVDRTAGQKRVRHSRHGGNGLGMKNMKHRRGEKKKREKREKGHMVLNIGVESGRFRDYIYRLRTFCRRALDDYYSLRKTPVMGALGVRSPEASLLTRGVITLPYCMAARSGCGCRAQSHHARCCAGAATGATFRHRISPPRSCIHTHTHARTEREAGAESATAALLLGGLCEDVFACLLPKSSGRHSQRANLDAWRVSSPQKAQIGMDAWMKLRLSSKKDEPPIFFFHLSAFFTGLSCKMMVAGIRLPLYG